jgi:hypothetical protein
MGVDLSEPGAQGLAVQVAAPFGDLSQFSRYGAPAQTYCTAGDNPVLERLA